MARTHCDAGETSGSDSFITTVANLVGVLIVLAVVAGLIAHAASGVDPAARAELKSLAAESESLESETMQLAEQIEALQATAASRYFERDTLALAVAAGRRQLDDRRNALDPEARQCYDLNRDLAAAEDALQAATTELARSLPTVPARADTADSDPTPITHTVVGPEIHFQLKDGRVALVPMDELIKLFEKAAKEKIVRLREQPQVVETIGPLGGFHLRYTIARREGPQHGGAGEINVAYAFQLLPDSSELGESWQAALKPGSEFHARLAKFKTAAATVTLWTYPDSFTAFRALKKDLSSLGFSVAARPMPEGLEISASPEGSRSSAQ